ncbi:putative GroES-like superfamily, alcohol dehydrogenase-like, NAD(P)-binding domain superfamily [Septoria linicola]|nr:putative GroES-like superfamily, alcohol dehydrogenase-like, NAD(P)-binding domain superfamily [Septoria linicola]
MTGGGEQQRVVAQWTLPTTKGFQSLVLVPDATLDSLADDKVRVRLHAASLNYRDLVIAKGGVPGNVKSGVVPGSDGAGVVEAVGSKVAKFKPGDRVVTHLTPSVPDTVAPSMKDISAGLGQAIDGTLRERGNFHESALLHAPRNNSFAQAATLTCSGLTAWNALLGLKGREVRAGSWVLIQGTGGVSVAALQFAVAVGANVVATTSNSEKAKLLEDLGANYVVNYREHRNWSAVAKKLTPEQRGFDLIVDVGGDSTLSESLEAIRTDGIVVLTGLLGGAEQPVAMLSALRYGCTVRGILLGSRQQFREMIEFVEEQNLRPVLDFRTWDLEEVKRAYDWLENQKHFSKVVIKLA